MHIQYIVRYNNSHLKLTVCLTLKYTCIYSTYTTTTTITFASVQNQILGVTAVRKISHSSLLGDVGADTGLLTGQVA